MTLNMEDPEIKEAIESAVKEAEAKLTAVKQEELAKIKTEAKAEAEAKVKELETKLEALTKDGTPTFPESYVKTLRDEAAANRIKAKDLSEQLKAMETYKTTAEELQSVVKTGYLEKIPEELRDKYKDVSLDVLKLISEDFSSELITSPGSNGKPNQSKSPVEMTQEDWSKLRTQNPVEYEKLMNELIKGK